MIQTSLFVERINQFPILSYVIDISPHTIMAVSLQEKEGENKKTHAGGEKERERERDSFWQVRERSQEWGEADRILKSVLSLLHCYSTSTLRLLGWGYMRAT